MSIEINPMTAITRQPSLLNLYEQYRPQMKPGDVTAFDGRAGFSALIKLLTHSQYFHVGMYVCTGGTSV